VTVRSNGAGRGERGLLVCPAAAAACKGLWVGFGLVLDVVAVLGGVAGEETAVAEVVLVAAVEVAVVVFAGGGVPVVCCCTLLVGSAKAMRRFVFLKQESSDIC